MLVLREYLNNMQTMWQDRLRELIREGRYRTQSELVEALNKSGFEATQASISRELKRSALENMMDIILLSARHCRRGSRY